MPLLTTADVARELSVTTEWVRSHAHELGAIRTSEGPGGVYRFEPEAIEEWKARRRLGPPRRRRRPGRVPGTGGVELVPLPANR